jgi:hypothetical protein
MSRTCSLSYKNCTLPTRTITLLKENIQPVYTPSERINLNTYPLKYDTTTIYTPVTTNIKGCKDAVQGSNPLLIEPVRGQRLLLSQPPFNSETEIGMYGPSQFPSNRYGKRYTDYGSINAGQIQYYYNNDRKNPYTGPNFVTPAYVEYELVKDPMDNVRPAYNRMSLESYDYHCNECDSYTHDTLVFRQELMEKQMRKRNSQEWVYRYAK